MQKSEKERAKNMRKKWERASKSEKERGENESNARLATSLTRYKRDTYLMVSKVGRRVYRTGTYKGELKDYLQIKGDENTCKI